MFGSIKKLFGGKDSEGKKVILAPVPGKVIPMKEVADPAFSQEILGKGVAIVPQSGVVVAPADGEVAVMFETKHIGGDKDMKEPASVSMVFSVALLFPVPALVCITIMTLSLLVQALVWIWPSLWIFFFFV